MVVRINTMTLLEELGVIEELVVNRASPAEIRGHIITIRPQLEALLKQIEEHTRKVAENATLIAENAKLKDQIRHFVEISKPKRPGLGLPPIPPIY